MNSRLSLILVGLVCVCQFPALLSGDDAVSFDVPVIAVARTIDNGTGNQLARSQKQIEIALPVSTLIGRRYRDNVSEFRFDVFWNRDAQSLIGYQPQTQTTSSIEGLVAVEKRSDRAANFSLNASGQFKSWVDAGATAQVNKKDNTVQRYQEKPQYNVVVASGPTHRGTGAFFRFHPSRLDILEGGRDLVVAFRVPQNWSGGIIQVECRCAGEKRIIGSWKEEFDVGRSFVLPVYLEGDDQARLAAENYLSAREHLMREWETHSNSSKRLTFALPFQSGNAKSQNLPKHWAHQLVQSGRDDAYRAYRNQLPHSLRAAAAAFVHERSELSKLVR